MYIVNKNTKAIFSQGGASPYRSQILDVSGTEFSVYNPYRIISNSCLLNLSSIEGRKTAVKHILGTSSKIPIPVNPKEGIYLFPTASIRSSDCAWFAFYQIESYVPHDGKTYVAFKDGTYAYADISFMAFDRQYKKTSHVIARFHQHIIFG